MLEDVGTPRPFEAAHRARLAVHPYIVVARERYDRVAAALAIEPRDPFMDIRLISFILSLPVEQLQGEGWPKLIIRRAMAGILPETVLWRSGKEHLGMDFTLALAKLSEASLLLRRPQLEELLHADALAALDKSPLTKMDRERKFKLTSLANWLARNQPVAESFER